MPALPGGNHGGLPLRIATRRRAAPSLRHRPGRSRKVAPNFRCTLEQLFIPAYFFVALSLGEVCYVNSRDEVRGLWQGGGIVRREGNDSRDEWLRDTVFAKRSRYVIENKGGGSEGLGRGGSQTRPYKDTHTARGATTGGCPYKTSDPVQRGGSLRATA